MEWYTETMSILATAYSSNKPRTKEAKQVAWVLAGIFILMAVFQLIGFNRFVLVIDSYWLPGGLPFASFLAAFLIAGELLSGFFLLRLKLSPAFRVFTMGLSWLVPLIWLVLTIRAISTTTSLTNIGFLGSSVQVIPGWWAVFVSVALVIMTVWSTWGLWPFPIRHINRKK